MTTIGLMPTLTLLVFRFLRLLLSGHLAVEVPAGTAFTIYIDGDRKVVRSGGEPKL